jgi:hypothetical protein
MLTFRQQIQGSRGISFFHARYAALFRRIQAQGVDRKGGRKSPTVFEDLIEIQAQDSGRAAQIRERVVKLVDLAVESRPISSLRIERFLQLDADLVLCCRAPTIDRILALIEETRRRIARDLTSFMARALAP